MKVFHSTLSPFVILLALFLCSQRLAAKLNLLSARCRSRCFSKEIQIQNITEIPVKCTSLNHCLACLKPCDQRKKGALSCNWLCGFQSTVGARNVCKESCKFLKHLHLQDGNYSCPPGNKPNKQCLLMRPEDVQAVVVSKRKKITDLNYTISWNGSWPSSTVFVVMSRQQKKLTSLDAEWAEIKQTTSLSVRLAELQPLFWYQFKVVAVNEYGTSPFSLPSRYIFADLRPPGQPREFKVTAMYITKGNVDVDVSWSKPDSAVGLPIHRYKLQWSVRLDQQQEKYTDLEVKDIRINGNIHQHTIKELLPNRTYVLEIQAITWWQERRARSRWLRLRIRTPALTEDDLKKKQKEYEPIFKVKGNDVFPKKPKPKADNENSTKPTTITGKGTKQLSADDIVAKDNNTQIVEAKRSVGHVLKISTHTIGVWSCVAVAVVSYLW